MSPDPVTILGGGPAGLATGYYARKRGIPFTIHEARDRVGGNAITFQRGEFRFDAGAHRLHDKDPEVTREIKGLLGDELIEVDLPSHIYHESRYIDFPLSPRNLVRALSLPTLLKAMADLVSARIRMHPGGDNFEQAAIRMYGRVIAEQFLLNYSQKLWGLQCDRLSVGISGARLQGMKPWTLLREVLFGGNGRAAHLEGTFYYPRLGYGRIVEELARACGQESIRLGSAVQAIRHDHSRIVSVSFRDGQNTAVSEVVSTIPLTVFLGMMEPQSPAEILDVARKLRFRNVTLVAIFLDLDRATDSATIYFPGTEFPFTRLYEPINRSRAMAPPGKTSVCVEYPCFPDDAVWLAGKKELIASTRRRLEEIGLIKRDAFLGGEVVRLGHAYPVLEAGIDDKVRGLLSYLAGFSNLRVVGRNGRFIYAHVHDMMRFGLDVVNDLSGQCETARPADAQAGVAVGNGG